MYHGLKVLQNRAEHSKLFVYSLGEMALLEKDGKLLYCESLFSVSPSKDIKLICWTFSANLCCRVARTGTTWTPNSIDPRTQGTTASVGQTISHAAGLHPSFLTREVRPIGSDAFCLPLNFSLTHMILLPLFINYLIVFLYMMQRGTSYTVNMGKHASKLQW